MSRSTVATSSPTSANDRQVGGDHYKTGGVEHWDLMHDADVPYLLAVAAKYVQRHASKAGRQDLEKAIHYQEKWLEKVGPSTSFRDWRVAPDDLLSWVAAADLRAAETRVLYKMLCYQRIHESLEMTRELVELRYPRKTKAEIDEFMRTHDPSLFRPGTPEDGGHHARQPQEVADEAAEEIVRWTTDGPYPLPESLSEHEWQHRCDPYIQRCYIYDVSAARYVRDYYKTPA